jgi:hypothetical protein
LRHGAPVAQVTVDGAHPRRQLDLAQAPVEVDEIDAALGRKA